MKSKKTLSLLLACVLCLSAGMTACGNNQESVSEEEAQVQAATDMETKEVHMNDYRGGIKRTTALKNSILSLVDFMKSSNETIRENNPDSFWTKDGYQDFVTNFMSTAIIDDTQWFNEEEATWEQTYSQICSQKCSYTTISDGAYVLKNGVTISRNEKDDYSITGLKDIKLSITNARLATDETYSGTASYRILYDCDKDWCKAYETLSIDKAVTPVAIAMLEYARIDDDTFAIQTGNERILVKLATAGSDTDIREREIEEFYYSKLVSDGVRTTFVPFTPLPEYDAGNSNLYSSANTKINQAMEKYVAINNKGDASILYGKNDSMFLNDALIDTDEGVSAIEKAKAWVFEDKALQQALCYKGGSLVVTTYNKLSEKYVRFEYALKTADKSVTEELEKMVEIKDLVGVVELKAYSQEEIDNAAEENLKDELKYLGIDPDELVTEDTAQATTEAEETTEEQAEATEPEKTEEKTEEGA